MGTGLKENRKRRLRRKATIAFLFSIFAISIGLLFFLTSSFGTRIILGSVNQALSVMSKEAPHIDLEIEWHLFKSAVSISNLNLDFPGKGSISAERIEVAMRPFQLLYNRLIIKEIECKGLRVKWDLTQVRTEAVPSEGFKLPALSFDWVVEKLSIGKADLLVKLSEGDYSHIEDFHLSADHAENGYGFLLETGHGLINIGKVATPLNSIRVDGVVNKDKFDLENVVIFLPGIKLELSGSVAGLSNPGGEIALKLDLPLEKLPKIWPQFPDMGGDMQVDVKLMGDRSNPQLHGDVHFKQLRVKKMQFEDSDLKIRLGRQAAILDGSILKMAGGQVLLEKAHVFFDDVMSTDLRLNLDSVELAQVLEDLSVQRSKVMQRVSGIVTFKGAMKPFELKGDADLEVVGHSTWTGPWRTRDTFGREVVGVPLGQIKLGLFVDKSCFELRDGTVSFGNTIINVAVTRFGFDNHFYYEYSSDQFDLADVGQLLGMDIAGTGSLQVTLDGPSGKPDLNAIIDFDNTSLQGIRLGHINGRIHYFGEELKFYELTGQLGQSTYDASVIFTFPKGKKTILDITYNTPGSRVEDLVYMIGLENTIAGDFSGLYRGSGRFFGPFGDFGGNARFEFEKFNMPSQPMDKAVVDISIEHNKINFKEVRAERAAGAIIIEGSVDKWDVLDLDFRTEKFQVSQFEMLKFLFGDSKGGMDISGQVAGTLKDPVVTGMLLAESIEMGADKLAPSEVHFEMRPAYFNMWGKCFSEELTFSAMFEFEHPASVKLDVSGQRFRYPFVLRRLLGWELQGGAVDFKLKGTVPLVSPANSVLDASIIALDGNISGIPLTSSASAALRYDKGRFSLESLRLSGPGTDFTAQGYIDTQASVEVYFKGDTEWRLVQAFTDSIEDSDGPIKFDLSMSGAWKEKILSGEIGFTRGVLELRGQSSQISNIKGKIYLDGDSLRSGGLSFDYMGGNVDVDGGIEINPQNFTPQNYDLQLQVSRLIYHIDEGMTPTLSGTLSINGQPWPLKVEGDLNVDEMLYTRSIRWQKKLIMDRITRIIRPSRSRDKNTEQPKFNFDIRIKGDEESIQINNNMAKLGIQADLLLTGSELATGLLQTLSSDRGKFYFQNNEFDVQTFMVEFREPDRIYPVYDIVGETTVTYYENDEEKEVKITLQVKGENDKVEVLLSSDSGLPQTDLVSLLIVGQPASQMESENTMASGLNALSDIYGVNEQIRDQFKLDEFKLSSEYVESSSSYGTVLVPKLTLGKEIGRDFFITYSTVVGEQQATRKNQEFKIEYRKKYGKHRFTLSGEWDDDSIKPEGNFGTDVRYQLHF